MTILKSASRNRARLRLALPAVAFLALLLPLDAAAQPRIDWTKRPSPGPIARIEEAMVYDSVANRMIMFGGYDLDLNRDNDIWEYDGAAKAWTNMTPALGAAIPPRRSGETMAFDPVRRRAILFGGLNDNLDYLGDTWEWDTVAKTWTNVTPGTSPTPRQGAKIVYDAANDRMILFGGVDHNIFYPETWVWNLAARTWTKLNPAASPIGRTFHGMAYNTSNNRPTVFAGIGYPCGTAGTCAVADFNDMWEFNGTTWVQVAQGGTVPPGRGWTGFAYDSAASRFVLYGGYKATDPQLSWGDTWTFSGGTWTLVFAHPNSPPIIRDSHQLVYDTARNRMVLFGGYLADVWEYAGSTWTHVLTTHWPPAQDRHSLVYDSDRDVTWMYGAGAAEVWEYTFTTSTWLSFNVGGPNGRVGAAAVYEQPRHKMILFGGQAKNSGVVGSTLNDTWEWDTAQRTWLNVTPGTSPSARMDHAMAFDAAHNRVVLFGGRTQAGAALGDTWLWNGSSWTNIPGAGGPSARFGHTMTYDPVRRVVVLFGGDNGTTRSNQTWEWNGDTLTWVNVTPGAGSPSARAFSTLSPFDAVTGGVVMFGGTTGAAMLGDAWIWSGSAWSAATANATAPSARQAAEAIFNPAAKRLLLFGGRDSNGITGEIWLATVTPAVAYPYPVQVTPSQAQGSSQTFTAQYRGTGGPALRQAWCLINASLGYAGGVLVYHAPGTNQLLLRNDNDTAWIAGTIGSGVLTNGQVTIDLATSSASLSGADLTLTLPMTFKGAFNGPKNIYMWTDDTTGNAPPDGWRQKGTFFANSANSGPSTVSVTPSSGSGTSQRFNVLYRELKGVNDLQQTYLLINTSASGANGAHVYYTPADNRIYLRDSADTSWGAGAVAGAAGVLSNNQVTLDASQVTVTKTSTDLTLSVLLTFNPSFAGAKNVYAFAVDSGGLTTGTSYQQLGTFTVLGSTPPPPPPVVRRPRSDFDGDGKTDVGVFRPSNGTWYLAQSASGGYSAAWGGGGDIPVPADYDGDGKTDIAVFRPSTGTWYIINSSTASGLAYTWGGGGDIPVPGDYDGDGKADIAVFRPSTGTWYIIKSSTASGLALTWGGSGDVPVPADYDGDGKADIAIFRPSTGQWFIVFSSTSTTYTVTWGGAGDVPVVGDYDGDGKAEIGIFRPSTGQWFLILSATGTASSVTWGGDGDVPVPGDYDGDGKTDIGLFRPSNGNWYIIRSQSSTGLNVIWGGGGDIALPSKP